MLAGFDVTVEVAFNAGFQTPAASRTWTDVTDFVEAAQGIEITRGRQDEFGVVQPSRLTLTLDNKDGRFTPENTAGAYYPNVKKGRPIRVTVADFIVATNLVTTPKNTTPATNFPANWAVQANQAITGHPLGFTVGATTAPTAGFVGVTNEITALYDVDGLAASATKRHVGLWVRSVRDANAALYMNPDYAGTVKSTSMTAGVWTWVTTAAAGSGYPVLSVTVAVGNTNATDQVAIAGVVATTSAPAVASYFDGDTAANGPTLHRWTGAANASTSQRYGAASTRFVGFVDEWPVEWPDEQTSYAWSRVTAASRTARMGTAAELRSIVEEEVLYEPSATNFARLYFPLGEPQGATRAGNKSRFRQEPAVVTQLGAGGTLDFGTGTGPSTDGLSAPTFTRVDESNGKYLLCPLNPNDIGASTVVGLEAFVTATAANQVAVALGVKGGGHLSIGVNATGNVFSRIADTDSTFQQVTSAATVSDGSTHHIAARYSWNSGTSQLTQTLIVDGVSLSGAAFAWPSSSGNAFPPYDVFTIGGQTPSALSLGPYNGVIAHAAVLIDPTTPDLDRHRLAGTTGFAGERSDQRIARLARLAGIPTAEVSVETGLSTSIAHTDTTGKTPLALMREVEATEQGLLFDGRDGVLSFHARSHRYGAPTAFTLDVAAQELEAGLSPKLDDQKLINDVTASRAGGLTTRVTDSASTNEYGFYRQSPQLLTTSDNEVQALADWLVNRYANPRVTIPDVQVDLLNTAAAKVPTLLTADLGTRFTITGLPATAPAPSVDLFIEGTTERIGATGYTIGFNTSPAALSNVWQLDSATYSQLGTSTVLAY